MEMECLGQPLRRPAGCNYGPQGKEVEKKRWKLHRVFLIPFSWTIVNFPPVLA